VLVQHTDHREYGFLPVAVRARKHRLCALAVVHFLGGDHGQLLCIVRSNPSVRQYTDIQICSGPCHSLLYEVAISASQLVVPVD
jgi:hypothetical protein